MICFMPVTEMVPPGSENSVSHQNFSQSGDCSSTFKKEQQPLGEERRLDTPEETCSWRCTLKRRCSMPKVCTPKGTVVPR